jgi:TonB-dependent SusC/RagA subfamily outer membrane receptor
MNCILVFLISTATLLISGPGFAQSGGPLPALSGRVAVASQVPSDSIKAKGTIRIICVASLKVGTEPLYIVDGLPAENEKIKTLNPKDISRLEVLKGINATSLYGQRASNGAILITTKKKGRLN